MGHALRIEAELDRTADDRCGHVEPAAGAALEAPVQLDRLRKRGLRQPRPGRPGPGERDEGGGARAEAELASRGVEVRRVERRGPRGALAAEPPPHEIDELDAGIGAERGLRAARLRETGLDAR